MKIISRGGSLHKREIEEKLKALDRSQGVIEFAMDGTILGANENFLNAVGYRLDEVVAGKFLQAFGQFDVAQSG